MKLRQNLQNLYERVSAGVHSDVDEQEARNLFFNVYLILGQVRHFARSRYDDKKASLIVKLFLALYLLLHL